MEAEVLTTRPPRPTIRLGRLDPGEYAIAGEYAVLLDDDFYEASGSGRADVDTDLLDLDFAQEGAFVENRALVDKPVADDPFVLVGAFEPFGLHVDCDVGRIGHSLELMFVEHPPDQVRVIRWRGLHRGVPV